MEGQSEKAFLNKLRESNFAWFSDLRIEVYGGTGNIVGKRIRIRLDKYIEDGYICSSSRRSALGTALSDIYAARKQVCAQR